ncbi:MAG TPA: type II secretion system protein GspL [Pseudomonadales bacterium]|nr:type II secretion system protein GspL [Pseudomonadales bacterium]
MAEHLYLRFAGEAVEWLVLDDVSGIVRFRGSGSLDTFAEMTRDMSWSGRARVLLAAEDMLLTHAAVPSKQHRQILQAVPYMVEEHLATDVENCHFAVGPRNEQGEVTVAVIARNKLEAIVSRLDGVGVSVSSVTPDLLHVPRAEGTSILVDGDRACVRTGKHQGFALELGLLPVGVNLLDEAHRESLKIYLHPAEQQSFQLYLSQIEAEFTGSIDVEELAYSPFEFLCRSFDTAAINLLQGEFAVEDTHQEGSRGWRVAAILAACAFGLQVMLLIGRGIYLDVKANQYEREARTLYTQVFPKDRNVGGDIMRHWRAHLAAGSGQPTGVFFDLFSKSAGELRGSGLTLENVNFNESRGDLILQLSASRYDAFDGFAQTLRKNGLNVEIGTISQDADAVKGSIKVRPSSS